MDLPYPSNNDVGMHKRLNQMDKMCSKISLSIKDISDKDILSKSKK
jgi:hypothetical protein